MNVRTVPIHGSVLEQNNITDNITPFISIPGIFNSKIASLSIDQDILSKHMMLIGGTGSGKSNVFYHLICQVKQKMNKNDVMIIFDTKSDYYKKFSMAGDLVLSNEFDKFDGTVKWNLFRELLSDGWNDRKIESNVRELALSIFREAIEKSKDPFFPNAACDLFYAIIMCIMKKGKDDISYKKEMFFNRELKRAFDESTIQDIKVLIESYPELASVLSYIGDGTTGQALGIYAELQNVVRKIFVGAFADRGSFSMRDFVRGKGGKTLFVEYDISVGNTLSPMYSLLFDLALKEALGQNSSGGNVYLVCDEFRLLPFLQHIDDGVNFGRSLGVKVIAGIQSINQLTEVYGEYRGKNILAGFSTVISFRANDIYTREYIRGLYGKNIILEQYNTISNSLKEDKREANVVEEWNVSELSIGEAIVGFPFSLPFKFQFELFR